MTDTPHACATEGWVIVLFTVTLAVAFAAMFTAVATLHHLTGQIDHCATLRHLAALRHCLAKVRTQ